MNVKIWIAKSSFSDNRVAVSYVEPKWDQRRESFIPEILSASLIGRMVIDAGIQIERGKAREFEIVPVEEMERLRRLEQGR